MKPATTIAAVLFALAAVAHLIRLFTGFEIIIAGWTAPLWISAAGFVIAAALAYFLYRENSA